jgi:predicted enzyme related to lactoylglutathione lyase
VNRPGFAHIAFAVDDVESALQVVRMSGGSAIGEIVSLPIPGGAAVTILYATDPEGKIAEWQIWSK